MPNKTSIRQLIELQNENLRLRSRRSALIGRQKLGLPFSPPIGGREQFGKLSNGRGLGKVWNKWISIRVWWQAKLSRVLTSVYVPVDLFMTDDIPIYDMWLFDKVSVMSQLL